MCHREKHSICLSHSLEVEEHAAGDEEGDEAEGVAAHVDDLGVVGVAAGHAVHERGVAVLAVDLAGAVVVWFGEMVMMWAIAANQDRYTNAKLYHRVTMVD